MSDFLEHIKQNIELTPQEESILNAKIKNRNYLKGQYIVQSGDVCKYNTYIESGKVRTFYLDDNGSKHIVAFGIEDWWVGDLGSLITHSRVSYYFSLG